MSKLSYDVVAAGARDYYEIAVALLEVDRLNKLYTDWYTPDFLRSRLKKRFNAALPSRFARSMPMFTLVFAAGAKFNRAAPRFWNFVTNYMFGFTCAAGNFVLGPQRAVVYSYYIEGFVGFYKLIRRRPKHLVCFQVHPSPRSVRHILAQDAMSFAKISPTEFVPDFEQTFQIEAIHRHDAALRFCDAIVCASSITRQSVMESVKDVPVSVVPYGSRFQSAYSDAPEARKNSKITLLSVCQITQRKGLHWAFHAMRTLPASDQDAFEWLVIGKPVDRSIVNMAPTNVRFMAGGVPQVELMSLMGRADLFVMPSALEGFGLTYIESLSQGTPIVYTSATGAADICDAGRHGYMVRASNWEDLAELFSSIVRNPGSLQLLRNDCKDLAARVNWGRFRQGIQALCSDVSEVESAGGKMLSG